MKKIKLTEEQLDQMSYADVAYLVLSENGSKMKIQDIFKQVISIMGLPETYFESKIGDFFGLISTDKRFTMIEKGFWDLRSKHTSKINLEEEIEEEEEIVSSEENEEEIIEEDEDNIDYDSDSSVDDDDEDDDLKDLVIVDDEEQTDMM